MDFQSPQNGMYDPSNFIDPSAIANSQMNGARQYPMSSVPQKRDSTGAALSRSQTPSQQAQFGFQQNFTPSPTMQNQHFRPGQVPPQRMQTASPAQNPHATQMSHMGFAQAPQMPQGFDPNVGGQFPVQSVSQVQPVSQVQLSQNLQSRQQEAQRQYAMRLQAQQQNLAANNMAAQQRHHPGQMPGAPGQHPGMQAGMMQSQMQNPQAQTQAFIKNVASLMAQHRRPFNPSPAVAGRMINLQQLYYTVMKFKGWRYVTQTNSWPRIAQMLQIDPQQFPTAPAELQKVYEQNLGVYETAYLAKQQAIKAGTPMQGQMNPMAQQMSPTRPTLPGSQGSPPPTQEYLQQMQRKQAAMMQHRQSDASMQQPQFDPALQQQQLQHQQQQQQQQHQQLQFQQQQQQHQQQQQQHQQQQQQLQQQQQQQLRQQQQQQLQQQQQQQQQPKIEHSTPVQSTAALATLNGQATPQTDRKPPKIEELPKNDTNDNGTYKPSTRVIEGYGGLDFESSNFVNLVDSILTYKPNMPALVEMGVVDIRALTMSIRSGLHAETRMALDALSKLTYEQGLVLELEKCEDLVDVLVDYAEDQLEILANDNPEISDILDLMPYEDVIHNCHAEVQALQDLPEFGTKAYDLDRTADRLLAITTIFRNLSFLEINHASLSGPSVLQFFSNAVRLVGTRVLLLRSHVNTFDFMKDLITFFSNTSTKIILPSREDAYTILHFICAFAPCPRPGARVRFTPYNAQVHRYLPSAVDSLAKLLARDDPNRSYYKEIFANEATSTPPYDLLTRAFALAISVVPDRTSGRLHQVAETRVGEVRFIEARIAEARKPYLMQGMLAADILASLAPGPESGVCRSWLESDDGWAASLIKFAMSLSATDASVQPPQQMVRGQRPMESDGQGFQLIVHRALSTLKRLGDKAKGSEVLVKGPQTNGHAAHDEDDELEEDDMETVDFGGSVYRIKADVFPKKETLLGALLTERLDGRSLRQFCGIGYLDDL